VRIINLATIFHLEDVLRFYADLEEVLAARSREIVMSKRNVLSS
jgi:hypothetical protein